jgi:hypothetical protein
MLAVALAVAIDFCGHVSSRVPSLALGIRGVFFGIAVKAIVDYGRLRGDG